MAESRGLGFPKTSASSLKEQLARTTLRNVRLQGHTYVELREDGKRFIFFCTLCLAPCYSDSVLFDHLKGNLHTERYTAAKATLFKENPWPFNDGVLFFHGSADEDKPVSSSNRDVLRLLNADVDIEDNLSFVPYDQNLRPNNDAQLSYDGFGFEKNSASEVLVTDAHASPCDRILNSITEHCDLVIPGVLRKDQVANLELRFIGVGQIAARLYKKDGASNEISRIWCEWLGKNHFSGKDGFVAPEHEFGVVTFAYNNNLGRKGLFDDVRYLLASSPMGENEESDGGKKKRRKSFSDPEDISESLSNQYDSSGEESQSSNGSNSRLLVDGYDDQLLYSRVLSSKTMRRELRRQQRVASERMCDICQQKMLPGKDVGTLFNRRTGKLVCSSRNVNGAFHLFHISCLVHWILLCELELFTNQLIGSKGIRRSRRKTGTKSNEMVKSSEIKATRKQINSVFCPECQGTGINVDGDELEKPTVSLSEIFKYKIKVTDARRAWMKNPELLQNCSTGFCFPPQSEGASQENVSLLKLVLFYHAD